MFGPDILVTPVLDHNAHTVDAYIPPSTVWYDLWSGEEETNIGVTEIETSIYQISAHVKAGSIVPTLV